MRNLQVILETHKKHVTACTLKIRKVRTFQGYPKLKVRFFPIQIRMGMESNTKMTYEKTWQVLADLLTELRKRNEIIPTDVMEDLRSAKTMIQILKADPSHIENIPRIETFIGNVESHLIFVAQEKFGSSFVDQWMQRLDKARRAVEKEGEAALRFFPGLPKGERWVRVKVSKVTPRKDVEKLAEKKGLSHKMQKNGYILVSGDSEGIKSFVKTMAEKFRNTRKR